jgi:ABC-type sugar transport system substrate-binding protein
MRDGMWRKIGSTRRALVALGAAAVVAVVLAACGSSSSSSSSSGTESSSSASSSGIKVKHKSVTVLDTAGASEAEHELKTLIEEATKQLGWSFKYIDGQGDPQKITAGAQSVVTEKPDAFISLSVEASQIKPQLEAMKAAGIDTCQAGGDQKPDALWSTQANENDQKIGELAGEAIAKSTAEPKVIILANPQNFSGIIREEGMKKALMANNPKSKIVFRQVIEFANPAGSAQKAVEDGLSKNPDTTSIYAVFDFSEQPALNVIKSTGSKAQLYGTYTGATTTPQLRDPSSPLAAVSDASSFRTGLACLDIFLKKYQKNEPITHAAGEKARNEITYDIVNKQNVEKLVPKPQIEQFDRAKLLAPFVEKWKSEYPG